MKRILLLTLLALVYQAGFSQDCTPIQVDSFTIEGDRCPGSWVTVTVNGSLNDATFWRWNVGGCDGELAQVGSSRSLRFILNEDTKLYVSGVGCATDNAGCTEILVEIENEPPVVECPEPVVITNNPGECGAIVNYSIPAATDNCGGEVTPERISGLASGSFFPVGMSEVTYRFSDEFGNSSECTFYVTVLDTEKPVITCVGDMDIENDPGVCGAVVVYESPVVSDNCEVVSLEQTSGLGSGAFFPVGETVETFTVTDASGNTSTCSFTVTVRDTEPPVITVKEKIKRPWPPNHKHFQVDIDDWIESVEDNCPGVGIEDVIIEQVSSDEPLNDVGDGNTTDDILIGDDCRTVALIAERQGTGNGRVYTVHLAVVDAHGNVGRNVFSIEIEHDQGRWTETINDGPKYTMEGCSPDGSEVDRSASNTSGRFSGEVRGYPNPFFSSFDIQFDAAVSDDVTVELVTLTGRVINRLYTGAVESGRSYQWSYSVNDINERILFVVVRGDYTLKTYKLMKK